MLLTIIFGAFAVLLFGAIVYTLSPWLINNATRGVTPTINSQSRDTELIKNENNQPLNKKTKIKRKVAIILCQGFGEKLSQNRFIYKGTANCHIAAGLAGGYKSCQFGCLELGDCVKACIFGALSLDDGQPVINPEKCNGCGFCVNACPRRLITLGHIKVKPFVVACNSHATLDQKKEYCKVGCIGCGLCIKKCNYQAIFLENNLATINHSLCQECGECSKACPNHCIR